MSNKKISVTKSNYRRKSKIMNFAGDLKHLDDGAPFNEIRVKAQKQAALEIDN